MILIITNKEDIHPSPVIAQLNESNVPVFRLNTEALLTDYIFNFTYTNNRYAFEIKNCAAGISISDASITSIWERRIEKPTAPHINDPELKRICEAEAWEFLIALRYYLKDKFWIGHAIHDNTASSKILQI
ncbi:MAG: hypothetical protein IT239_03235 [Bacteroidia bacterium]|nr:hypothetical protein [Bacteroidia bacterium]